MVISSLGLTGMASELRTRIVRQVEACLARAGIMMQFQYVTSLALVPDLANRRLRRFQEGEFLKKYFSSGRAKPVFQPSARPGFHLSQVGYGQVRLRSTADERCSTSTATELRMVCPADYRGICRSRNTSSFGP